MPTSACSVMPDSLQPHRPTRLPYPWDFPGENTTVGCHFLLHRIFLTQGSNPRLLYLLLPWQADSLPLQNLGSLLHIRAQHQQPASEKIATGSNCWISSTVVKWTGLHFRRLGLQCSDNKGMMLGAEETTKMIDSLSPWIKIIYNLVIGSSTPITQMQDRVKQGLQLRRNVPQGHAHGPSTKSCVSVKDIMKQFCAWFSQTEKAKVIP